MGALSELDRSLPKHTQPARTWAFTNLSHKGAQGTQLRQRQGRTLVLFPPSRALWSLLSCAGKSAPGPESPLSFSSTAFSLSFSRGASCLRSITSRAGILPASPFPARCEDTACRGCLRLCDACGLQRSCACLLPVRSRTLADRSGRYRFAAVDITAHRAFEEENAVEWTSPLDTGSTCRNRREKKKEKFREMATVDCGRLTCLARC